MFVLKALRIEQWSKNIIVLVPFLSLGVYDSATLILLLQITFAFSLVVSSTYIINDLKDKKSDENHPTKYKRPVASGRYKNIFWINLSIVLFSSGNFYLFKIEPITNFIAFLYVTITLSYSFKLKYIKYFDIFIIALLFSLRLYLGSLPLDIPLSFHILIFTFFSSLGLVVGKKLSILNDEKIKVSKVKKFLQISYSNNELKYILFLAFATSSITYSHWIFAVKSTMLNISNIIYLILSLFFLINLFLKFIKLSLNFETEEIVVTIKNNMSLKINFMLFSFFAYQGLF